MTNATKWLAGALMVVVVIGSVWTARIGKTNGEHPLPRAQKVVLFAIPGMGPGDITPQRMPNLYALSAHGARGALQVKTFSDQPSLSEANVSIGAGTLLSARTVVANAFDAHERVGGVEALTAQRERVGHSIDGAVIAPAVPQLIRTETGVGALASQLERFGRKVGVVTNASVIQSDGEIDRDAPAVLAAVNRFGAVDNGTVSMRLLRSDPSAPFGRTVDDDRFEVAVQRALGRSQLVIVDPGETTRAMRYEADQTKGRAAQTRTDALTHTDRILGELVAHRARGTVVIVAGVTPPSERWTLTPIVISGSSITSGRLASPSTHRDGIVTITDIAPSVLGLLGVPRTNTMAGSAMRITPGSMDWKTIDQTGEVFDTNEQAVPALRMVFIVSQVLIYLFAFVLFAHGSGTARLRTFFEVSTLAIAGWPLATYLARVLLWINPSVIGGSLLSWLLAVLGAFVLRKRARRPLDALLWVTTATVAVIMVDLFTGGHLLFGSVFGYWPGTTMRYFGVNNATFAILGMATLVASGIAVDRTFDARSDARSDDEAKRRGLWFAGGLMALAVIVDGSPWIGADVGGILTFVPVLGMTLFALWGYRVRLWHVIGAVVAGFVVLAGAVGIEAMTTTDRQSHVGRFFLGTETSGEGGTFRVLVSKWEGSMAPFAQSAWTWAIPVVTIGLLYYLVILRGWRPLLPEGSPLRIVVIGGLVFGIVGWLLNDSGILVTALVFVYLGPLLIWVAYARGDLDAAVADEPATVEERMIG